MAHFEKCRDPKCTDKGPHAHAVTKKAAPRIRRRSQPRYPIYSRKEVIKSFDSAIAAFAEEISILERQLDQNKSVLAMLQTYRKKLEEK